MNKAFRSTIILEVHPAARKHDVSDSDIAHAIVNAMSIDDRDNDTRLYLGSARNADLLEVVTVFRGKDREMAIHAMKLRPKFMALLPKGCG